jgi:3'(2'), 5'-bisphosphate nucleotidase
LCPPVEHSRRSARPPRPPRPPPLAPTAWPAMDKVYTAPDGTAVPLGALVALAESAGAAILSIYDAPDAAAVSVTIKSDDSPLTAADTAANAVICGKLAADFPHIPIMSEENKNAAWDVRKDWRLYWCVDPLDGTKEFVRRNGEFTVNIALMASVDGTSGVARPVVGVVSAPVVGKTYFAADGVGAYVGEGGGGQARAISAAKFTDSDEGLVLVVSRSHMDARTEEFVAGYAAPVTKSMGSSLKFMLVATGEAHVYPRLAPTMEWDTAASQIVVEEAGGTVLVHETGKVMRYNKEDLLNPSFRVYGAREQAAAC